MKKYYILITGILYCGIPYSLQANPGPCPSIAKVRANLRKAAESPFYSTEWKRAITKAMLEEFGGRVTGHYSGKNIATEFIIPPLTLSIKEGVISTFCRYTNASDPDEVIVDLQVLKSKH